MLVLEKADHKGQTSRSRPASERALRMTRLTAVLSDNCCDAVAVRGRVPVPL